MKNINILRLKHYQNKILTVSENSDLLSIAMKCYEEAGIAIYFARAMLSNLDTTNYLFPSEEFCVNQRSTHTLPFSQLSFYPNPISSELMVSGLGNNETSILCTVFDLLGREVQQTTLAGNGAVPFQHMKSGTYILQLMTTDNQFISTHKVVKMEN